MDALGAGLGLLPRRRCVVESVGSRREAVGPKGRVMPQVHDAENHRRLDFVVYGATTNGEALCCDATLVSPLLALAAPSPVPMRGLVAAGRREVTLPPRCKSLLRLRVRCAPTTLARSCAPLQPRAGRRLWPDVLPLGDVLDLASASAPSQRRLR